MLLKLLNHLKNRLLGVEPFKANLNSSLDRVSEFILDFCFSTDKQYAFSVNNKGVVIQWDLSNGKPIGSIVHLDSHPLAIGVDDETLFIVVNSELLRWDLNGKCLTRVSIPCNGLFCAAISEDASLALLGRRDEGVQCISPRDFAYDLHTQEASNSNETLVNKERGGATTWLSRVQHHSSRPSRIALANDNSCALTYSPHDAEVKWRVWGLDCGECCGIWYQGEDPIDEHNGGFVMATDGLIGYIGGYARTTTQNAIALIDLKTSKLIRTIDVPPRAHAKALEIDGTGLNLFIGFSDGELGIIKLHDDIHEPHYQKIGRCKGTVSRIKYLNQTQIVTASQNRLQCWQVDLRL